MKTYFCWLSHTCWVCRGGSNPAYVHVAQKVTWHSPCDTVPVAIEAANRSEALKLFRKTPRYQLMK